MKRINWQYQRKKRAQNKAAKDEEEDEGEEVEVSAVIVKKRTSILCMLNGLFYNSSRPKIERVVMQMIQKMRLSHSHDGYL
jgi:sorbitol-specific phosphotransferase system component IIBC